MVAACPSRSNSPNQVLKLRHLTLAEIAGKLQRSEREITEVCRMLLLPIPDYDVEPQRWERPDEARAALRERIPKKWRDHYR